MRPIRQVPARATAVALAVMALGGALGAQSTAPARETIQLAFGFECEDRFLIRNDGSQTVTLQYGVQGNPERSTLSLTSKQSVEISSTSGNPVELWVAGKLAATERKGTRACSSASAIPVTAAEPDVIVRPIDQPDYTAYTATQPQSAAHVVVVAPPDYGYDPGYPYYPYYGYGSYYPYYPYYRSGISVVVPFGLSFGWPSRVHTTRYAPVSQTPRGRVVSVPRGRAVTTARPRGRR